MRIFINISHLRKGDFLRKFVARKFVVGITGASGVRLGIKFARYLAEFVPQGEVFLVMSEGAKMVEKYEDSTKKGAILERVKCENISIFNDDELFAPISSGSFGVESTFIIPCSANTLAKIACGISDTLITRAALVALKERKALLLAPREMPLNAIMLQNMLTLTNMGATIAPPMLSYYANSESLGAIEDFLCGKWLDCANIAHNLYMRWGEK